jgi:hypothetical protein
MIQPCNGAFSRDDHPLPPTERIGMAVIPLTGWNVLAQLDELGDNERAISSQRRRLHAAIDHVYITTPLDTDGIERLEWLEALERDISAERHQLHGEIDVLRARAGLPSWRAEHDHAA